MKSNKNIQEPTRNPEPTPTPEKFYTLLRENGAWTIIIVTISDDKVTHREYIREDLLSIQSNKMLSLIVQDADK